MINLIAILAAFFGGLLGRALAPGSRFHRILAFIVLVCISTGHMPLLLDVFRFGFPPLAWGTLTEWCASRYDVFLLAGLLTGAGWLCSYCVQTIFED